MSDKWWPFQVLFVSDLRMRLLYAFILFVGLVAAAPTDDNKKVIIDSELYLDEFVIYTSNYDIVKIVTPINAINFEDDESKEAESKVDGDDFLSVNLKFFFVEAELNGKGEKEYKGLYIFQDGKATKLLENGVDIAAPHGENKFAYFAATDGIYLYNYAENKVEKYGTVTDSIINIVHRNVSDDIVILTKDKSVYVVSKEGTDIKPFGNVKDLQEIAVDWSDNLYYYGPDKKPYMTNSHHLVKYEGLPENPSFVKFVRPPVMVEDAMVFLSDEKTYFLFANGTTAPTDFEVQRSWRPTAASVEAALVSYFGREKKIYQFNTALLVLAEIADSMKEYLEEKKDDLQEIATKYKHM